MKRAESVADLSPLQIMLLSCCCLRASVDPTIPLLDGYLHSRVQCEHRGHMFGDPNYRDRWRAEANFHEKEYVRTDHTRRRPDMCKMPG